MTQKKKADGLEKPAPEPAAYPLPILSFQGVCNAWECDHFGHMNVRFYVNRAYQGWAPFAAAIQLPQAFHREAVSTLRPRDMHIRFHREMRAGEQLNIRAGVLAVSDETVTLYQEMRKIFDDGELAATIVTVLEHVEAKTGKPFAWSKKARDSLAGLTISELPKYAEPRSLTAIPDVAEVSLARAQALNVPLNGLSMLLGHECDSFGRMLPEFLVGRQSDSGGMIMQRALRDHPGIDKSHNGETVNYGAAALEGRLSFKHWPSAGDLIQVNSGLTAASPKTMRFVNWSLDPVSGESWGHVEILVAHFNLEARRAAERPPEFNAALEQAVVRGLTH